jgi:hypothetical protein
MATMEERLATMEATEAIRRLKIRYAEVNDQGFDPDELVALFTPDGVWDAGEFGRFVGRDEMRDYWVETGRVTSFARHYITNHIVDVEPSGVTATGRCYLIGMSTRQGQAYWMAVRYAERYRKVDGEWLFEEMKLLPAFMTPYETSWASDT